MATDDKFRIRFDPTLTIRDVLAAVAVTVTLTGSYALLDKRIGVLEEKDRLVQIEATTRINETREALRDLRQDMKDLQRSIQELARSAPR